MKSYLIERAVVAYVARLVESQKLAPRIRTHRDLAKYAFPQEGERLWKYLRLGQKGKAQNLTVQQLYNLAEGLGIDVYRLLLHAEMLVENGFCADDDTMNAIDKKKTLLQITGADKDAAITQ